MQTTGEIFSAFSEGQLVADRYRVVRKLGAGSMGMVLHAVDLELDKEPVALKLLFPHLVTDQTVFARFRNEVVLARRLSHPNIVRLYDFGNAGGGYYFISMEFVSGYSLKERIYGRRFEALTLEEATRILFEIGQGIAEAHRHKIIHRDLKPDNIMISEQGNIKITDFGLARQTSVDKGFTQSGETVGTPCYMAPEQIRGEVCDARADLYSLGIMAYEMVTCQKPFDDDNWMTLATMHLKEPMPEFPPELNIPGWFQDFVYTSTAKRPEDRFQDAEEWSEVLRAQIDRTSGKTMHSSRSYSPAVLSQFVQSAAKGREVNRRRRRTINRLAKLFIGGLLAVTAPIFMIRAVPALQRESLRVLSAVERGAGVDLPTLRGLFGVHIPLTEEALLESLNRRDLPSLELLLAAGVSPDAKSATGQNAIFTAIDSGDFTSAVALIQGGATLTARDPAGRTPLMAAAARGATEIVQALLARKSEIDLLDSVGRTALFYAAANNQEIAVRLLLQGGATPNVVDLSGDSLLGAAVKTGSVGIVRTLIDSGAVAKVGGKDGNTPLHLAAESGNVELTTLLLSSGGDPTARNNRGRTPREVASGKARGVFK